MSSNSADSGWGASAPAGTGSQATPPTSGTSAGTNGSPASSPAPASPPVSGAASSSGLSPSQIAATRQVAAGTAQQIALTPNSIGDGADIQGMQHGQIMDGLHGIRPGEFTDAAAAYRDLGDSLENIRQQIITHGETLAQNWSGDAAAAALRKFQAMHDQAAQLSAQAYTTADAMDWMGKDVLPQFQGIESPVVMNEAEQGAIIGSAIPGGTIAGAEGGELLSKMGIGSDGNGKANQAAQGYLQALTQHVQTAHNAMAKYATAPYNNSAQAGGSPGPAPGGGPDGGAASGGYPGGYPGGIPNGGATGGASVPGYGGAGSTSSAQPFNPASLPGTSTGNTAGSLAGYTPPASTSPYAPAAGNLPGIGSAGAGGGAGAGGFGGMPGGAGGFGGGLGAGRFGTGKSGSGLGEEGPLGEDGIPGTKGAAAEGAAAEEAAARSAGTEAAGAEGGMGMPMGAGAGGGQQDKERQRQAWMNEDQDIWGARPDGIGPVIE